MIYLRGQQPPLARVRAFSFFFNPPFSHLSSPSQASSSSSSSAPGIPILRDGPMLSLGSGAVSFKATALALHPVEAVQSQQVANEWDTSLRLTALAHGQAAAIEKRIDRAALSQIRRLPGGPESSHALLDTYLGRAGTVGVEDFLNGAPLHRNWEDQPLPIFALPKRPSLPP